MQLVRILTRNSLISTSQIIWNQLKGGEFVFNYVRLLFYKCHEINPNRAGSYIDSPNLIKNKKATINPINKKDNKCFQYVVTVALYHEQIGRIPERITKIKPFINRYKW